MEGCPWGALGLQRGQGRHHEANESQPVYFISRALRPASPASTSQPAASLQSPRSLYRPGEVGTRPSWGQVGLQGGWESSKPCKVRQDPGGRSRAGLWRTLPSWEGRGPGEVREEGAGPRRARPQLTRCSTMMSRSVSFSPFTGSTMSFRISFSTHSRVTTAPLR